VSEQPKDRSGCIMVATVMVVGLVIPTIAHGLTVAALAWNGHWVWAVVVLLPGWFVFRIVGTLLAGLAAKLVTLVVPNPTNPDWR
jgi:hypothetical protein